MPSLHRGRSECRAKGPHDHHDRCADRSRGHQSSLLTAHRRSRPRRDRAPLSVALRSLEVGHPAAGRWQALSAGPQHNATSNRGPQELVIAGPTRTARSTTSTGTTASPAPSARTRSSRAIPLEEALPTAKQIAEALEYGVAHRDPEPRQRQADRGRRSPERAKGKTVIGGAFARCSSSNTFATAVVPVNTHTFKRQVRSLPASGGRHGWIGTLAGALPRDGGSSVNDTSLVDEPALGHTLATDTRCEPNIVSPVTPWMSLKM